MRLTIQRVTEASVLISQEVKSSIKQGLVILLGICEEDSFSDIDWLCKKIIAMRIFSDEQNKMNKSIIDVNGEILLISQFTLYASVKKGNRPSYIRAASPSEAIPLYEQFKVHLEASLGKSIATGEFGADMKVHLCNDGPVTINIDSKNRE
jgi:D-tyrosyl-tRNA(Tyr) deacylase